MPHLCADLAIPNTVDKLFTYLVPPPLAGAVRERVRALVPFGSRTVVGFVVKVGGSPPPDVQLKHVFDVLDEEPILSEELFQLTRWMAKYYFAPWGDVLKAVVVQDTAPAGKRTVSLSDSLPHDTLRDIQSKSMQAKILNHLSASGSIGVNQLKKIAGARGFYGVLNNLAQRNLVKIKEHLPLRRAQTRFDQIVEMGEEMRPALGVLLNDRESRLGTRQRALMRALFDLPHNVHSLNVAELLKTTGATLSSLKALERRNLITIARREVNRSEWDDADHAVLEMRETLLNESQRKALDVIRMGAGEGKFAVYLLHGVTGSGKTHIYIEAVRDVLARGKNAIVLVPEISLTSQIINRFRYHFGDQVVAFHSKMSLGERYDAWRSLKSGKYRIVIGPRSAVFAPLEKIGLIVVDEEQEAAYKQYDQTPRYHARDVAVVRGRGCDALVILGSATPSIESYSNALSGKYILLELPDRVDGAALPNVEIVDMASERKKKLELLRAMRKAKSEIKPNESEKPASAQTFSMISDVLKEKIEDRLSKREGIILLQNRRGYSSFIECPQCGYVEMCEHCSITLTYHRSRHQLRCHYCGFTKTPVDLCAGCGGVDVRYRGIGTQRVEEELAKLFPLAKILRMDLDTTTRRKSHDVILKKFSEGEVDILIGTQMVAKGLDFSRVTLVGVISAETQMLLPDFRSTERTFQLLTQVAGRAGRSTLAGEVIIQTYLPAHESLLHVPAHDFKSFYRREIENRKELDYPPFSQLTRIEFKGEHEEEVMRSANTFAAFLKSLHPQAVLLGPAPAVITRVQGKFRWHIVLKNIKKDDPGGRKLNGVLTKVLRKYEDSGQARSKAVNVVIDVDPSGMM
jgi:primosomal protein N' (replication factor Y) (superfamily II helicase)